MRTYVVGRGVDCDIQTPPEADGIGRQHLELTLCSDGSYLVTDRGTSNGTEFLAGGVWQRLSSKKLTKEDTLRLARQWQTSVGDLLKMAGELPLHAPPEERPKEAERDAPPQRRRIGRDGRIG